MPVSRNRTERMLVRWCRSDPGHKEKIEMWLDEAIKSIADGNGAQMVSGTVNGVSFAIDSAAGMSVSEWAVILDSVILHCDAGTAPASKTQGTIF